MSLIQLRSNAQLNNISSTGAKLCLTATSAQRAVALMQLSAHGPTASHSPSFDQPQGGQSRASKVLLHCDWSANSNWLQGLRDVGLDVELWPDVEEPEQIGFVVCWNPPDELFEMCKNIRAVNSMGAGVDFLAKRTCIPPDMPLLRITDPVMGNRMATWVFYSVVSCQRRMPEYRLAQQEKRWAKDIEDYRPRDNADVSVGIMGLGVMGTASADLLATAGYRLSAWTRRKRQHSTISLYSGAAELQAFVSACDVLVCLLPLTTDTEGIISAELLTWLPEGASVINGARGRHHVEEDILAALDDGHVSYFVTDVTDPEPLPPSSRLWHHPRVTVFPHVASFTAIPTAAAQIKQHYDIAMTGNTCGSVATPSGALAGFGDALVNRTAGY